MPVSQALFRTIESSLLIIGVVLWVRALLRGDVQRWLEMPARLPAWSIGVGDFLLLPLVVLILLVFVPYGLGRLLGVVVTDPPNVDAVMVAGFGWGAAFIGGTWIFRRIPGANPAEGPTPLLRCLGTGLLGLVYFLPVCTALALGFTWVLDRFGVPHADQEIVQMIRNSSGPGMTTLWLLMVVGMAPIGEELFFRAGLFRFLSNRTGPMTAACLSALVFAALHANLQSSLPLFLLGLLLAGLYQKTGRIHTSIILHAAFNLNTLLGIFTGVAS